MARPERVELSLEGSRGNLVAIPRSGLDKFDQARESCGSSALDHDGSRKEFAATKRGFYA